MTKVFAQRYQQATKKHMTLILNQFCSSTGYARAYASFLLHNWGRKVKLTIKGVRSIYEFGVPKKKRTKRHCPLVYDERVDKALKQLWYIADGICGKRLAQFIRDTLLTLERFKEIAVDDDTRRKLLAISPATFGLKHGQLRIKLKVGHSMLFNILLQIFHFLYSASIRIMAASLLIVIS